MIFLTICALFRPDIFLLRANEMSKSFEILHASHTLNHLTGKKCFFNFLVYVFEFTVHLVQMSWGSELDIRLCASYSYFDESMKGEVLLEIIRRAQIRLICQ